MRRTACGRDYVAVFAFSFAAPTTWLSSLSATPADYMRYARLRKAAFGRRNTEERLAGTLALQIVGSEHIFLRA